MKQNPKNGYSLLHEGRLTLVDLEDHLSGKTSQAIYLLDENKDCSTICFDIDIPKIDIPQSAQLREQIKKELFLPEVAKIINYIRENYDVLDDCFLIEDTGGRGYHIWLFFSGPMKGDKIVAFLNDVRINCGFEGLE